MICHIVQKLLRDKTPFQYENVFYKCARNWKGEIQNGLVVNTKGEFFVHSSKHGTFLKPVSRKDHFLYHDYYRISATKLVYCSFTKNHPELNGVISTKLVQGCVCVIAMQG